MRRSHRGLQSKVHRGNPQCGLCLAPAAGRRNRTCRPCPMPADAPSGLDAHDVPPRCACFSALPQPRLSVPRPLHLLLLLPPETTEKCRRSQKVMTLSAVAAPSGTMRSGALRRRGDQPFGCRRTWSGTGEEAQCPIRMPARRNGRSGAGDVGRGGSLSRIARSSRAAIR